MTDIVDRLRAVSILEWCEPMCAEAADEIEALRRKLRRAGEWDEYHPAYIAGAGDARRMMAGMAGPVHFDMSKKDGDGT